MILPRAGVRWAHDGEFAVGQLFHFKGAKVRLHTGIHVAERLAVNVCGIPSREPQHGLAAIENIVPSKLLLRVPRWLEAAHISCHAGIVARFAGFFIHNAAPSRLVVRRRIAGRARLPPSTGFESWSLWMWGDIRERSKHDA